MILSAKDMGHCWVMLCKISILVSCSSRTLNAEQYLQKIKAFPCLSDRRILTDDESIQGRHKHMEATNAA